MSRAKALIDMTKGDLIASGVFPDQHPLMAPLWGDTYNVTFTGGKAKKALGWTVPFDTTLTDPIRGVTAQILSTDITRLHFGSESKLGFWDGTDVVIANNIFTGFPWTFVSWGDWMFASNGTNRIRVWQGSALNPVPNAPFSYAEIIIKDPQAPFLLAMNTSNGSRFVEWCDFDDPLLWDVTVNTAGGNINIRELEGPIVAAAALGDRTAVYGRDSLHFIQFIGAPNYFGTKAGPKKVGAVGKLAVASDGSFNYGVGKRGVWRTDGVQVQYLDIGRIKEWINDNVNWDLAHLTNVYINERQNRLDCWFPVGLEVLAGWGYDLVSGSWTFLNYGITAASERDVYDNAIGGRPDGTVVFLEDGYDRAGEAHPAYLQTKPMQLGSTTQWAVVDEYKVLVDKLQGTGCEVRLGAQSNLDEAIVWQDWQVAPTSMESLWPIAPVPQGIYISFALRSENIGEYWELSGFKLFGAGNGVDTDE